MSNIPVLIVLLPLSAALLCMAFTLVHRRLGRDLVFLSLGASLVLSVIQLKQVIHKGAVSYRFGGYAVPYGIEFRIDSISAVMLVMIFTIGLSTALFCMSFECKGRKQNQNRRRIYPAGTACCRHGRNDFHR